MNRKFAEKVSFKKLPGKVLGIFLSVFLLCSCASSPLIQPQINSLAVAGRYETALRLLEKNTQAYGEQNQFLYQLDLGLVSHLAGRYDKSIASFERAKRLYDDLFTVSLTNEATTWLVNDNSAPYRGEDFERVLVNVFQALNFAAQGNIEEALVEARDVDSRLGMINRRYDPGQENVYKEDAFARMLMGLLYESRGTPEALDDAYISYRKALHIYTEDYGANYQTPIPSVLIQNFLSLSEALKRTDFSEYRKKFPDVSFVPYAEKRQKGEIYIFHYQGLSPVKHQVDIPLIFPDRHLLRLNFPVYFQRAELNTAQTFNVFSSDRIIQKAEAELCEDIDAIARENLKNRKARVLAKAFLRSSGKYLVLKNQEKRLSRHGQQSADWVNAVGNLYNIFSEQADLRSWQTLPAQIRVARFVLDPGDYEVKYGDKLFARIDLKKGDKVFLPFRP